MKEESNDYELVEVCNYYAVSTAFIEKSYIVYTLKTKLKSNEKLFVVDRRFSDFEWLHNYLASDLNYQFFF